MVDPSEDFRRFEEQMNRMMEDFWSRTYRGRTERPMLAPSERGAGRMEYREPLVDLFETDDEIIATAELPGLDKDDIRVYATSNKLEISAEKSKAETQPEKKEKKGEGNYVYRERSVERFYRSIQLPSTVDPDKAKSSYKNGVLEIRMPKTEVTRKTPMRID